MTLDSPHDCVTFIHMTNSKQDPDYSKAEQAARDLVSKREREVERAHRSGNTGARHRAEGRLAFARERLALFAGKR